MNPWVLVGCGARKRDRPCQAQDLYTGPYVQDALRWARTVTLPRRILILSAAHGLVRPTQVLAPYNVTFADQRHRNGYGYDPDADPPVADEVIAGQVERYGISDPVLLIAGRAYFDVLGRAAPALHPHNPFRSVGPDGRIGYQRQAMRRHHGRIPAEGRPAR